jgi:hypothetical protein
VASNIEQSNWSVEHIRAARHSKLMSALVLALRKVPIFAPGGGAAALEHPTNPSYSVAVSDEVAATAREQVAKDADAARLSPLNQQNIGKAQLPSGTEDGETPKDTPGPASETMAADAMNVMQLSESLQDLSDDDRKEKQDLKSVSSLSEIPPEASNIQSSASLRLQKTSPQGRRRTVSSVPLHVTPTSRQDPQSLERVPSFGEA